jgi:hypothetical protein
MDLSRKQLADDDWRQQRRKTKSARKIAKPDLRSVLELSSSQKKSYRLWNKLLFVVRKRVRTMEEWNAEVPRMRTDITNLGTAPRTNLRNTQRSVIPGGKTFPAGKT